MQKRIDPGSPAMGDDRYKIIAKNASDTSHARKRIVISYIYLLLLQKLKADNFITAAANLVKTSATLQAKTGKSGNQAAHQLLRELKADGAALYTIQGITPELKKALVYCCAATSDIHASFNMADGKIETAMEKQFVDLAKAVISDRPPTKEQILKFLIEGFSAAAKREQGNQSDAGVLQVLEIYLSEMKALESKVAVITKKDPAYWLALIARDGIQSMVQNPT